VGVGFRVALPNLRVERMKAVWGLVEDVVFGEEFFEFGFVNAADDAF
jgi:hypothetical protein